jgi:hypothetical protein
MHDNIYNPDNLPISFKKMFHLTNHHLGTRQKLDIVRQRPRTNFSERLTKHSLPIVWNNLNDNLKNLHQRSEFKKNITTQLLSEYAEVICCNNTGCNECFSL